MTLEERVPSWSQVPGILWPPMLPPEGAQALALQYQLEDTQWWPEDRLSEWQFRALRPLVAHARSTVPHYRRSLRDLEPERLDAGEWGRIPVVTRGEVQAAGAEFFSESVPEAHGALHEGRTSGSTGRPLHWSGTALSALMGRAFTLRNHLWHGRDFSRRLAVITVLAGKATGAQGWGPSVEQVYRSGPLDLLSIRTPVDEQVRWLADRNPEYLLTYPSNLEAVALQCREDGRSLTALREVWTYSEALPAGLRDLVRECWDVPLVDFYGAKETGFIALQCPARPDSYHVQSESARVEILREDGTPCGPGEIGRVVVTPLHNFAMPLIRYDQGDYAEPGERCPCGRGLPVIRRILGRRRNLVTLPGGARFWPVFGAVELARVAPVRQVQLVQTAIDRMELRLAAARPLTAGERDSMAAVVRDRLGYPFAVDIVVVDGIPRGAGGKYEDFVSMLDEADGTAVP